MKKFIFALTLIFGFSFCNVVFAEESFVEVNNLDDIIAATGEGESIKLMADIDDVDSILNINQTLTIDLNGFSYSNGDSFDGDKTIVISGDDTTVTIMDSSSSKTGKIIGSASKIIYLEDDKNTLILDSGTIENSITDMAVNGVFMANDSSFVMNDGKINIDNVTVNSIAINVKGDNSTFVMNGGEVFCNMGNAISVSTSLDKPMNVTINDGRVYAGGEKEAISTSSNQIITINGGVIDAFNVALEQDTLTDLVVTGGEFNANFIQAGNANIDGAKFNAGVEFRKPEVLTLGDNNDFTIDPVFYNVKVGGNYYSSFEEAVNFALTKGDMKLTLLGDIVVNSNIIFDNDIEIDLNGFDIKGNTEDHLFTVVKGNFVISGEGTISNTADGKAVVNVLGSNNIEDESYTIVTIDEDVTLSGWAGLIVNEYSDLYDVAYGVTINANGKFNAISGGYGLYVNDSIQDTDNYPVFNIGDDAVINSVGGSGVYAAGYAKFNINGATVTGFESSLNIKSGIININGGIFKCVGDDSISSIAYSDGVNPSGAVIQIESNPSYAGNVELTINDGNFVSENGVLLYEYLSDDATSTSVNKFVVNNGKFTIGDQKEMFLVSDGFKNSNTKFVNGGYFSLEPSSEYVAKDHSVILSDDYYGVYGNISSIYDNGSINVPSNAMVGDIVTISDIVSDDNYGFSSIKIFDMNDRDVTDEVDFNSDDNTFKMPNYGVKVVVSFSTTKYTIKGQILGGSINMVKEAAVSDVVSINSSAYNGYILKSINIVDAATQEDITNLVNLDTKMGTFEMPNRNIIVKVRYVVRPVMTNVNVRLTDYRSVNISWDSAYGADGYLVYYKKSSSKDYVLFVTTTKTSVTRTGLTSGVSYTFKVIPYVKDINNYKRYNSYRTKSIYTLKRVATPVVVKYSSNYVKVKWANIPGETGYQISRSIYSNGTNIVKSATSKSSYATIKVSKNKKNYFKVRAYKIENGKKIYGPWSYVRSFILR